MKNLTFISPNHFSSYSEACLIDLDLKISELKSNKNISIEDFEYYLINSSLYSSKIEGNTLDVNSFFRNKDSKNSTKIKEVQEIEDLVKAYQFATENKLTLSNFLLTHEIASQTFLPKNECGKIRKVQVGIRDSVSMRPVYMAVELEFIETEISKLFNDINFLLNAELSIKEVFYYASVIHLWIAFIHPFTDGNGRAARLIEKWFLAEKLGKNTWGIYSEKYYWDNKPDYYKNIALGYNYYALHWDRCIPFLMMLPKSI